MSQIRTILSLLFTVLLALAGAAHAVDEYPQFEYKQGPGWKEQENIAFPAMPREDDLIEIPLQIATFPFRVYLDRASLSVGEDRVSRYTVVLESAGGVRNVFYEGIRCANGEYRTYAVGVNGEFDAMRNSEWKAITRFGTDMYRYRLEARFLCDVDKRAREPREVLTAIRRDEPHQENYY